MIVLLIVEGFEWVFGQMANAICKHNPDISFIYCDAGTANRDPKEFKSLVEQADVVHWITNAAHAQPQDIVRWSLTNFPSLASLYHVADGEERKVEVASLASNIHVMSSEWRNYLLSKSEIPEAKIHTIPLGVDTSFFSFSSKAVKKHNIFRIGCFGYPLAPNNRKGVDILLDALNLLDKDHYQLVLAGPGWENLIQSSKQFNIENNGYVDNFKLRKLYQSLNTYVIPSRVEGGPVTLLEAFSSEIPVISTPVGMSIDLIKHGVNGFFIPINSPESLAEQIKYIRNNADSLGKIKEQARIDAEKHDWKHIAPLFGNLYCNILSDHPSKKERIGAIAFRGKKILPKQQRAIIVGEKRYNYFALLIKQRNYILGLRQFLKIPRQYWATSFRKIIKSTFKF